MRVFEGNGPLRHSGRAISLENRFQGATMGNWGFPWLVTGLSHILGEKPVVGGSKSHPRDLKGPADASLRRKWSSLAHPGRVISLA